MAIINPQLQIAEYGQDLVITLTIGVDITGWTLAAYLRAYNGGTALATVTPSVVTAATGVVTITFTAAQLTQPPGYYVWEVLRTNSGYVYPVVDPSGFLIRSSSGGAYPTLTNLAELYGYIGETSTSDADAKMYLGLLTAAETAVKRICGRQFYRQTVTEYLDGNGLQAVSLRETPITSITSVYLDTSGFYGQGDNNPFGSTTLLTSGADYFLKIDNNAGTSDSGLLYRAMRVWPSTMNYISYNLYPRITPVQGPCLGCIKVTYVGGYNLIPEDLKQAIFQIVQDRKGAIAQGEKMSSESFENYAYSLGQPDSEIMKIGSVGRTIMSYRRNPVIL
jgi:hypothetical protein